MGLWIDAVRELGFPAAVCLILLWAGKSLVDRLTNELGHKIDGLASETRQVRETLVALLEHIRNGPAPPPMIGRRQKR